MDKESLFDKIYRENQAKVFRLCKGYFSGDEALAQDATQETFIKVWEHLDRFRGDASITTWIYRITVNTCLLFLRKEKRKVESKVKELPDDQLDETPDDVTNQRLKLLYKALKELDETSRMVMLMILEDVPYGEIAEVIGVTEETLRVRIHRIKKRIAKKIKK